jgi:hypothetical protein
MNCESNRYGNESDATSTQLESTFFKADFFSFFDLLFTMALKRIQKVNLGSSAAYDESALCGGESCSCVKQNRRRLASRMPAACYAAGFAFANARHVPFGAPPDSL